MARCRDCALYDLEAVKNKRGAVMPNKTARCLWVSTELWPIKTAWNARRPEAGRCLPNDGEGCPCFVDRANARFAKRPATGKEGVMGDLSVLAPPPEGKDEKALYQSMDRIVSKIVVNAVIHRPTEDILREVYITGLYHGSKLSGPPPRKPDYVDLSPPTKRRGKSRKSAP